VGAELLYGTQRSQTGIFSGTRKEAGVFATRRHATATVEPWSDASVAAGASRHLYFFIFIFLCVCFTNFFEQGGENNDHHQKRDSGLLFIFGGL